MGLFSKPKAKVEIYANEGAMKRGIKAEARRGYVPSSVDAQRGSFKPGKALLTGGLGYFTPGGLRRGDKFTVAFARVG